MIGAWDWAAFGSGLIGAVVGAGATLGGVWLTQRREVERDRMADARLLRNAKGERIRADTVVLALVADALEYVGKQMTIGWPGETKEARAERLGAILSKVTEPLGPAVMRLQLETGTETLVETYKATYKAFNAFRFAAEANERDPASSGVTEMLEQLPTLETGVEKILASARAQLQELEKPI